ncbi:helix-turn-helix domain-containing protein [Nocardiopsis sp. RSe5-2]|uniref:DNA-3-methyladenine glycosylase II n=1 Tax=Nocardiopsis endophytica TaxID=3018445 RepID=A0ABT4UD64_9ACTN|nr:DNA-3-methyladenine glycosylase 2 [Nocardiopsis endophytica]MDA2814853.1 helix-turn-helix domain-containing protein [Nocardiopsis endophytica]
MDDDQLYRAIRSKDARFDGVFYVAVTSTGIYCRPSCPATVPKRANVRFHRSAAAAQAAGFRACKRCRPDASPGSPEWNARADAVGRAMRLIADGEVDRGGVPALASAVGYSERQLNRLLTDELGAGPLALARARRAQTARVLIETTSMPVSDVAFAAGFASIRQFNSTMREVFDRTPRQMRERSPHRSEAPADGARLRLPLRAPIAHAHMRAFLGARAVPGVEEVRGDRYRRVLDLPHGTGVAEVDLAPGAAPGPPHLPCRLHLEDLRDLGTAVERLRRLLDLDTDPGAVAEVLGADPLLAPAVRALPGLRAPGAADPDEYAVRAVLGQQVSVAAARTAAGRLAERYGKPLPAPAGELVRAFPRPEVLAAADPADLPMPRSRGRALVALCEALASGAVDLGPGADREEAVERLLAIRGIGPWTADYIRMRALGDPDVLLAGDLGVRRALERLGGPPGGDAVRAWSPYRSYATHYLWAWDGHESED